jgi:hypothetical protein
MHITFKLLAVILATQSWAALAQQDTPKAIVAIVGDADRFNIGQGDFCSDRSEVASPSEKQFRIPADKQSFFYIRSRIRTQVATYTCEGDYSFMPERSLLHIIRYTLEANRCKLEMFLSEPGGTPIPIPIKREESRSCLFK